MAKGYWIANVSTCAMQMATKNMSPRCPIFCANLVAATLRAVARPKLWRERTAAASSVLEFPSYEAAMACYRSPEYAKAITLRQANADADLIVIEGYDGPQP